MQIFKKSKIYLMIIFILCTNCFLAIGGEKLEQTKKGEKKEKTAVKLPRFGFYGFGDFQGKELKQKKGYFLQLNNVTTRDWSGYSRLWKMNESFDLKGCNILVVTVEGAEDNFESTESKFMKWFVQYEGCKGDVTLICSDDSILSNDPEFVGNVDGTFEYSLPHDAIKKDSIKKIGITLFKGAKYIDVKIKAHLAKK